MRKWKLHILKPRKKEVISNPSWDQIKSVLDQVDGYDHLDNVFLECEEAGDLLVAGGNEENGIRLYHVSYFYDGSLVNLVNPSVPRENEEYITITVERVGTDIPKQYLVEYSDMIKAFKHFFETGELTEDQKWE
ncbi:Imm1 family immunity protein [Thermoflavimicrobium dichotomicum]|uniref:Immunity protein Imm1 n=1 Tax=Thermoflavimicrobium dichotomicum TaxID=46223 RepID=A0A1I3P3P0_9BACL|nr:Imm1 family immunity protein [Thermoflavimicrobium dichotomicum]SFJ16163.1 Immunity protein Imm1 [Thermoflavimicrobium dichotomicum]